MPGGASHLPAPTPTLPGDMCQPRTALEAAGPDQLPEESQLTQRCHSEGHWEGRPLLAREQVCLSLPGRTFTFSVYNNGTHFDEATELASRANPTAPSLFLLPQSCKIAAVGTACHVPKLQCP